MSCCNKFTRQYNYTLILLGSNANIINTRKMIPPICEVKIQEPSAPRPPTTVPNTQTHRVRAGNSRIFAKTGHWSEEEKLRYLLFIDHHGVRLATRERRRLWRVFRSMAAFVGTRRAAQCRSHHQKMEHYYQSLPNIVTYLKNNVQDYHRHYQQARPQLMALSFGGPPLLLSDGFLEDSANNEQGVLEGGGRRGGRRRSSNTSIRLEDEGDCHQLPDKDLPKTDHSLHILPQAHHPHFLPNASRPRLDYALLQGDTLPCPTFAFPFSMPAFPFVGVGLGGLFGGGINETAGGFFEFHRRNCSNWEEAGEWMECEGLYRLWRSTLQSLIHSNL